MMMRVLIIEDEKRLADALVQIFGKNKMTADASYNGIDGLDNALSGIYDVIVLDIMLPGMNGIEVLGKMRREGIKTPVILLTAKDEISDKVKGLDSGADDYLTKPFSVDELLARLRVTLRRLNQSQSDNAEQMVFTNGVLRIDYAAGCAYLNDEELHLTPIEYKLLSLLARNCGKVLTHNYITQQVWGTSWENNVASLRVFMATLRKKLEPDPDSPSFIQTHVGIGYRMVRTDS
jgi:two-component system KDP operon response regulator KdpE